MSCYIMTHYSIRRIACTLADILNARERNPESTIATSAAGSIDARNVLRMYYKPGKGYNAEKIAQALYALNVKAYNIQYREQVDSMIPLPDFPATYTLYNPPGYAIGREIPQPWHYQLCNLLDCYLHQTDIDGTACDPLRESLQAFNAALMAGIVRHCAAYSAPALVE